MQAFHLHKSWHVIFENQIREMGQYIVINDYDYKTCSLWQ